MCGCVDVCMCGCVGCVIAWMCVYVGCVGCVDVWRCLASLGILD